MLCTAEADVMVWVTKQYNEWPLYYPRAESRGGYTCSSLHLNDTRHWAGRTASVPTPQVKPVIQDAHEEPKLCYDGYRCIGQWKKQPTAAWLLVSHLPLPGWSGESETTQPVSLCRFFLSLQIPFPSCIMKLCKIGFRFVFLAKQMEVFLNKGLYLLCFTLRKSVSSSNSTTPCIKMANLFIFLVEETQAWRVKVTPKVTEQSNNRAEIWPQVSWHLV